MSDGFYPVQAMGLMVGDTIRVVAFDDDMNESVEDVEIVALKRERLCRCHNYTKVTVRFGDGWLADYEYRGCNEVELLLRQHEED